MSEWDKDGKIIKGTNKELGGTMRLGLYKAKLHNSLVKKYIIQIILMKDIDTGTKLINICKVDLKIKV